MFVEIQNRSAEASNAQTLDRFRNSILKFMGRILDAFFDAKGETKRNGDIRVAKESLVHPSPPPSYVAGEQAFGATRGGRIELGRMADGR